MKYLQFIFALSVLTFFSKNSSAQTGSNTLKEGVAYVESVNQDGSLNLTPQSVLMHNHYEQEGMMYCCAVMNGETIIESMFLYFKQGKLYLCELSFKTGDYVAVHRPYTNFQVAPKQCGNAF